MKSAYCENSLCIQYFSQRRKNQGIPLQKALFFTFIELTVTFHKLFRSFQSIKKLCYYVLNFLVRELDCSNRKYYCSDGNLHPCENTFDFEKYKQRKHVYILGIDNRGDTTEQLHDFNAFRKINVVRRRRKRKMSLQRRCVQSRKKEFPFHNETFCVLIKWKSSCPIAHLNESARQTRYYNVVSKTKL